ncbi:Sugar phosphate permease [Alteribacillus persepolensis]|uniref:Sugar phosphate permease n=1 Tax=Alteribacillus persepolensis TaxID=568899 RepID=A0A1G8AU79_9BACI|nr:MFS transporter [Alteribacillus persepolensis]SDH24326.1 Sugar phosphate permease [Alteribacillus persepolensis]
MFKKNYRWFIIGFLTILMIINFMDRIVISIATEPIMEEFGFTASQWGWVLSAFFWGLVPFSFIAGLAADKVGPKKVYTWGVAVWSFFTIATAGAWNLVTFFIARVFFGAGEGPTMSNGVRVISNWTSPKEYSSAYGLAFSGVYLGPAIGAPIIGWMVATFGWRSPFYVLGVLGFLWIIGWKAWFTNKPEESSIMQEEEKRWLMNEQDKANITQEKEKKKSMKELLSIPKGVRATIFSNWWAAFCFGYALYFLMTWLPGYLNMERGFNLESMGFAMAFPYLGAAIGIMGGGRIADYLLRRTGSRRIARAYWCSGSLLLAMISLLLTVQVEAALLAVACLTVGGVAIGAAGGVVGPVAAETLPAQAGVQGGFLQVFQTMPGIFAPVITGYIVEATQSFSNAFYLTSIILLSGVITTFLFLRPPNNNDINNDEEQPKVAVH